MAVLLCALTVSEEEIEDYVLDYLAQLFSEDGEGVESVKMETKTCKVTLTRGGKLSTDSFLTELANEVITDLPTKIKGITFSQEPPKANTKVKTSDFKIGKSKVMLCPVIGEDGKITSQQKILVTVDTVLKDEEALEKLCTISEMNRSLNVDFQENSLYYIQLKREVSLVSKKLRLIVMQVQSCVVMVNTVSKVI